MKKVLSALLFIKLLKVKSFTFIQSSKLNNQSYNVKKLQMFLKFVQILDICTKTEVSIQLLRHVLE